MLLVASSILTYFFGTAAFRLNSGTRKRLIPKSVVRATPWLLGLSAACCIAGTTTRYMQGQIELTEFAILNLLAGAAGLFSYYLYKYVIKDL